jgi:hypothetical protein
MPPRSRGIRDRKAELGESGEHTGLNGVHLPEARGARARHQPGSGGVSPGQPSNGNGAVLTHDPSRDNGAALAPHHLRVSIFGLGYVGTVSAACLARQGHHVIGLDSNPAKVEVLASGRSPVIEPGLAELIAAEVPRGRLAVSSDAVQAVRDTDISLYCVGTPGLENGSLDLDAVRAVCRGLGPSSTSWSRAAPCCRAPRAASSSRCWNPPPASAPAWTSASPSIRSSCARARHSAISTTPRWW